MNRVECLALAINNLTGAIGFMMAAEVLHRWFLFGTYVCLAGMAFSGYMAIRGVK